MRNGANAKRQICVVTGSRADYTHLYWLMRRLQEDPKVRLRIVATGMHLSPKFGWTYKMIEKDGFAIDDKVNLLRYPDSDDGIAKAVGLGCRLFADAFKNMRPDMVVVLGDRYEILSAAIAAYLQKIPLVHIHGGETSQGAVDEAIRHTITKMATLHFAATETYRKRIIQLGENPRRVFNYGAPVLEGLHRFRLLKRSELATSLGLDLKGKIAIITIHPTTLEKSSPNVCVRNLLKALRRFDLKAVFTQSNADAQGSVINRMIRMLCARDPKRYRFIPSLGTLQYFSCLKHFNVMIGNSSSGLIEAPSFKIPVVNIGDRQKGRVRAENVIDVGNSHHEIEQGIRRALSPRFRARLSGMRNPYQSPGSSQVSYRIKEQLKQLRLHGPILKKEFYDVSFST